MSNTSQDPSRVQMVWVRCAESKAAAEGLPGIEACAQDCKFHPAVCTAPDTQMGYPGCGCHQTRN